MTGVLRRAGFDRVNVSAGVITVLLSLMLVATGPIYADAVTVSALRKSLRETPAERTSLEVDTTVVSAEYTRVDAIVTERVERATSSTGAAVSRRLVSDSYELPGASDDDLVDLAVLRSLEGIADEATLIDGEWPDGRATDTNSADVAVDARSAEVFGLSVGDVVAVVARRDTDRRLDMTVVGIYEVDDQLAPFWGGDTMLIDGRTESSLFRTYVLVTSSATVLAVSDRPAASWFVRADFGSAAMDDIEPLRRQTARLESDLTADFREVYGDEPIIAPVELTTGLPGVLARSDRALTVTRSSVLAITLQLSVLAGYALTLVAGLIAEGREDEYGVLRARGASPLQLLGRSAGEALVLTVPAAVAAPTFAAWFAGAVSRFGALGRTGLTIEPEPVRTAYIAVVLAAAATVALLAWPTFRQARAAQRVADGMRQRSRSGAQRAGVDIAVAVLAGVAIWRLSTLGEERTADIRGRFGVDPLLVVAPALGLFGGAFLALRVVPVVARLAERVATGTRSAVPALAGWQVARRPTRYARSALLLIMAVALGVFATTYESTWERSQQEQATHQTGADLVITPNQRTNDSIGDLHLRSAYEEIDGVDIAMPVVRRPIQLPNSEIPAELVVLDAAAAGDVVMADGDAAAELAAAFDSLASGRPTIPAVELPTDAIRLDLVVEVAELDEFDENEVVPAYDMSILVVVQDRHGLLHRIPAGAVTSGGGPVELATELARSEPPAIAPAGPLGIVEIEFRAEVPREQSRALGVEVRSLASVNEAGVRTPVDADGWTYSRTSVGPIDELPAVTDASGEFDGVVAAHILTGVTRFGATTSFGIRPSGTSPSGSYGVVVSRSWFEANQRELGDQIRFDAVANRTARIVGTVDALPTIDPNAASVVLVDLPTAQMVAYELGSTLMSIDAMWLTVDDAEIDDGGTRAIALQLERKPYEATSVLGRDQLASDLLSDPPAVGTIGALMIGFVTAAGLAVIGFLVAATVSARDRAGEFALLRALGLTARQLAGWTFLEQAALIVLSLAVGNTIGLGLAAILLPIVSLTAQGGGVYPPVDVVYPWSSIAVVQVAVLVGLVAAVLAINLVLRRLAVAQQLRAGAT